MEGKCRIEGERFRWFRINILDGFYIFNKIKSLNHQSLCVNHGSFDLESLSLLLVQRLLKHFYPTVFLLLHQSVSLLPPCLLLPGSFEIPFKHWVSLLHPLELPL